MYKDNKLYTCYMGKQTNYTEEYRKMQVSASECYLINVLYEIEGQDRTYLKGACMKQYDQVSISKAKAYERTRR